MCRHYVVCTRRFTDHRNYQYAMVMHVYCTDSIVIRLMLFSERENEKHNIVMRNLLRRLYHKFLQNLARCYLQREDYPDLS